MSNFFIVFYENFDDEIAEFDIHDGRHRLLLGPHQGRAEADADIRHRHQVLVTEFRYSDTKQNLHK